MIIATAMGKEVMGNNPYNAKVFPLNCLILKLKQNGQG
jgi:hypothetical protein